MCVPVFHVKMTRDAPIKWNCEEDGTVHSVRASRPTHAEGVTGTEGIFLMSILSIHNMWDARHKLYLTSGS